MALAPNGKVIVAGRQNNPVGPDQLAVARFKYASKCVLDRTQNA
jgi:hypothetical protein